MLGASGEVKVTNHVISFSSLMVRNSWFGLLGTLVIVSLAAAPVFADDHGGGDRPKAKQIRGFEKAVDRLERIESFDIPDVESTSERPSTLFIGPQGQARIYRGEVTAAADPTLTVKIWGLSLVVDISGARFLPANVSGSGIHSGDRISVRGTMNKDSGVIKAATVHDLSIPPLHPANPFLDQLTKLIERLRELQTRLGLPLTPFPTSPSDTVAPVISSVITDNIATTSARIRWTTDEAADSNVWYGTTTPVTTAAPTLHVFSIALVGAHDINLSGLTASTTYYFILTSRDATGNTATSTQSSFVTTP